MSQINQTVANEIHNKILLSRKILIVPHKRVDGDALGSALALQMAIKEIGREAVVAVSDLELPEGLSFLPGFIGVRGEFDPKEYDLVFLVDHNDFERSGFLDRYPEWPAKTKRLVVLDHHQTAVRNSSVADEIVFSDPRAPATTMILFQLFQMWGVEITPEIATCLLLGIYTDTNSFKNTNVTEEAVQGAAELIRMGARLDRIAGDFFQKRRAGALQLWGRAMSRIKVSRYGIAVTVVYEQDFIETGTDEEALGGLANDMVRSVKGTRFGMILVEKNGGIKASLRTASNSDFDVSKIAALFGGGGHAKASGFFIRGKVREEPVWVIEK